MVCVYLVLSKNMDKQHLPSEDSSSLENVISHLKIFAAINMTLSLFRFWATNESAAVPRPPASGEYGFGKCGCFVWWSQPLSLELLGG